MYIASPQCRLSPDDVIAGIDSFVHGGRLRLELKSIYIVRQMDDSPLTKSAYQLTQNLDCVQNPTNGEDLRGRTLMAASRCFSIFLFLGVRDLPSVTALKAWDAHRSLGPRG